MGNRAVIAFKTPELASIPEDYRPCIYLHWNGSRDSVEAFLQTAKDLDIRPDFYGIARLTQLIANYIGGTLAIGITCYCLADRDNWDNGVYWVDDNFNIVGREYQQGPDINKQDVDSLIALVKKANLYSRLDEGSHL